ncbi:MAG: tetratricopeptide repeat protein [Candidatus Aminicenantes bacterium]|nr:tetratricopeptide repeat protein [Candidatus Aminicenantes bacterium]
MKKALTVLFCVLVAAAAAAGQNYKGKARVLGVVLDQDGNPVAGVKVSFFLPEAGGGFSVQSEKDGRFTAAWLRRGNWNIDFEKVGYEPKKISLSVSEAEKNPEVKMTLKKVEGLFITEDLKKELTAANALFEAKDFAGALAAFQAMTAKYPEAYILEKNVGNCFFALEQYDKAEESYQKILAKDPANADAIVLVGNTYANRNETEKALEWYSKIQVDKIKDTTVLYNIGTNYFNLGKVEEAVKYFKAAVDVQADNTDALYRLGLAYVNLQRNAEAIVAFEAYLKVDSTSEQAAQVRNLVELLKKK